MELRHLRYFVAVAEERHITHAAQRLGIQQPPLSQQIKALEAELGVTLFRRVPRGVELTVGGTVFLKEARTILAAVSRAGTKASRAARGEEGEIAIGFTSSALIHPIAREAIRGQRTAHPAVALELREGNAAELTEAVATGNLTVAIVRAPVARPPNVAFRELLREKMLLVLPADHPLVSGRRARNRVSLRALSDEAFVLVRRPGAPGMYGTLIAACQRVGFTPRIAAEVERMLTNVTMVAAGMGVSIVPRSMRDVHRESVAYCELTDAPELVAPITLLHRREESDPAALQFMELLARLSAKYRSGGRGTATTRSPQRRK
jgi:DNA-binding transcriptional LysR family regulator